MRGAGGGGGAADRGPKNRDQTGATKRGTALWAVTSEVASRSGPLADGACHSETR
jgi:hypothetical protein